MVVESRRKAPVQAWFLAVSALALGSYSGWTLFDLTWSIPKAGGTIFSILIIVWVLALVALLVRPLNVMALRATGAFEPTNAEWSYLEPLWHQALERAGVPAGRYELLLVDEDVLVHRDLGPFVVAVRAPALLDRAELSAQLAQRLARQTSWTAPLVGLCLWAALPLVLLVGLGVLAFVIVRGISRAFGRAADGMKPSSEAEAAIGCLFYLVAAAGVVLMIAIGVGIAVVAAIALVIIVVVTWLARQADAASTGIAAEWGYLPNLRDSVDSGIFDDASARWLRPLSTYASVAAHRGRLHRT